MITININSNKEANLKILGELLSVKNAFNGNHLEVNNRNIQLVIRNKRN